MDFTALKAHTLLPVFSKRLEQARACTEYAYKLCRSPFVAFSAGKDSSVMLHTILTVNPRATVRILTGGETRLLHSNIDTVFDWWREKFPKMNFQEVNVDHVFAPGWENATFYEQYQTFQNEWEKYLHSTGDWDGVFIGLRKEESNFRRIWLSIRMDGHAIRQYQAGGQKGVYRICPLADWREIDVGAYVVKYSIPLLSGYENGFDARTKCRIGGRAMIAFGQLADLRARDPENYQKIIDRFPELARWT